MPFKTLNSWLFNGDINSPIDDILIKGPIEHKYLISLFMKNGKLNKYLNSTFNNINLWSLDKRELLIFIKKLILYMRINRFEISYIRNRKRSNTYKILRYKFPHLKDSDIYLMMELIEKDKDKNNIYMNLGIKEDKVTKKKVGKKETERGMSLEEFIKENFSTINI